MRAIGSDLRMDYTAVGQTTHLAARMEQIADPGAIVITPDTLALVEGYVEVKSLGPVAAIRCGCAIRDAVQVLGMAVRVGIHAGEVEYDDRTMSGITVFTAVRITGAAQPDEVLVSHTVKELSAGSGITFTDRGTHTFKGLPGEWRLFTPDVPEVRVSTS